MTINTDKEKFISKLNEIKNELSDKDILKEINRIIKKYSVSSKEVISPKQKFEKEIISLAEKFFQTYPEINNLPIIHYGVMHKYECAGEDYCFFLLSEGLSCVNSLIYENNTEPFYLISKAQVQIIDLEDEFFEQDFNFKNPTDNQIYQWYGRPKKGGVVVYINKDKLQCEIAESESGE